MLASSYFSLLLLVTLTNGQIDTSSCPNFSSNVEKCNTDNMLSRGFNSEKEIISTFLSDPAQVCGSDKEKIKATSSCIIDIIRGCGSGESIKLYTSSSAFTEALDYACNNAADYNPACLNQVEYLLCVNTRATAANMTKVPTGVDFQLIKEYYCSNEEFKKKCLEWNSGLDTCSQPNTKQIQIQIEAMIGAELCKSTATSLSVTSGLVMVALFLFLILFPAI